MNSSESSMLAGEEGEESLTAGVIWLDWVLGYFFFLALLLIDLVVPGTECVGERGAMTELTIWGLLIISSSLTQVSDRRERSLHPRMKLEIRQGEGRTTCLFFFWSNCLKILLKIIVHRLIFIFVANTYNNRALSFSSIVTLLVGIQFPLHYPVECLIL